MHLGHASEGILVLHPRLVDGMKHVMGKVNGTAVFRRPAAAGGQATNILSNGDLPRLLSHLMDAIVERCQLSSNRFQTESTSDIAQSQETVSVKNIQSRHGG